MTNIQTALLSLFNKHRIVFWYDAKQELRQEYEALWLPGVEKIELNNNEYGVKYRLLHENPSQKFLLYHAGPEPEKLDNWLLDVQLAQGEFRADQVSLWTTDLGLGPEFWELVQEHAEFFKAEARLKALKALRPEGDSHPAVRTKLLAVCVGAEAEARTESILEVLLAEQAEDRDEKISLIHRCSLDGFLWGRLEIHFGYRSGTPSLKDFAIALFKACYAISLEEPAVLTQDALVFLKRWKDSRKYHASFETLSERYADVLGIKNDLQTRDVRKLVDIDTFKLIDVRILNDLVQAVLQRTISAGECANLIWRRRATYWFGEFEHIYEAVNYASQFMSELDQADLRMESLADGVRKYQKTWYRLDQYYRKFIYHMRASKQTTLLQKLAERIEAFYSNNYLQMVNDNWQHLIDARQMWDASPIISQGDFFERYIREYLRTKNKVAVIVSDALRYEIGEELTHMIAEEDRFTAELEPMVTLLPSYTQLGMAALLPHQEITLVEDGTAQVDGLNTAGKENRARVLNSVIKDGAAAIRSADLLNMSKDESREFTRQNQVMYIYHNQIDAMGDKVETEDRVFEAVADGINELVEILKKLTNANLTNVIITSDHGFIYQHHPLDESEFASQEVQGKAIYIRNRRFVVGTGIEVNDSVKSFSAIDIGLSGDLQVVIPKSINRLRLQGSGSRYVHGGAALQEVIIPVIKINKKKTSDVTLVDVDIITSSSAIITSGQISVAFYQVEPISTKLQARQLRAGIYTRNGDPISDSHQMNFDFVSENSREREVRVRFVLSRKADDSNNQTVYLNLEEQEPGTSHYKPYRSVPYELRRSFTTDFD
jgi:uncharacterized protein (TIGR02687 family)